MLPPEPAVSQRSLARWQTSVSSLRRSCSEALMAPRTIGRRAVSQTRLLGRRLLVPDALEDRKARIAEEARVGLGARATPEPAPARGRLPRGPPAARAEADVGIEIPPAVGYGRARRVL